ncbi:pts system N-acetylglucosamine-specific eiicba component [Aeromonas diversa CDC 2478-85]|uniref:Pts system N-acetylglucosamine-specific eiicba component n=1 Tax=Aeromonas diversa CDC 2478-85 TaxID=1268237 RepID=N9U2W2_9GAMM|nr:pts system N-acetylglucosamine-specific eiicba component [Aeromonas diversa CDC 2478-85]
MHLTRPLTKTLQRLGYALLLPVSLLPLAALLIRLGDLQLPVLSLTGQALFGQMPLIYAIAIAFGLSERGHGGQALTGAVGYLLLSSAMDSLLPHLHADMMCGLLAGITVALCWPWAMALRLPRVLHPLQGEPLAMLLSALACLLLVFPLAGLWPAFEQGIVLLAQRLLDTPLGAFCYGVLNRLLIPFGLHQVLGSLVGIGTGDLDALAQALPPHAEFVAGLYPIIMFGLPGATLAIWLHRQHRPKGAQGGMLLVLALTSALLGITEPIEFLFAFTAPRLFLAHALLTGFSLALCKMIGIEVGSYFSAGLLDLLLCAPSGVNAFWLIPIGILFFVVYALTFWLLLGGEKLCQLTPRGPCHGGLRPRGGSSDAGHSIPQGPGGARQPASHQRLPDPAQPAGREHGAGRSEPATPARLPLLDGHQRASTGTGAGPQRRAHRGPDPHAGRAPVGSPRQPPGPPRSGVRTGEGEPLLHPLHQGNQGWRQIFPTRVDEVEGVIGDRQLWQHPAQGSGLQGIAAQVVRQQGDAGPAQSHLMQGQQAVALGAGGGHEGPLCQRPQGQRVVHQTLVLTELGQGMGLPSPRQIGGRRHQMTRHRPHLAADEA